MKVNWGSAWGWLISEIYTTRNWPCLDLNQRLCGCKGVVLMPTLCGSPSRACPEPPCFPALTESRSHPQAKAGELAARWVVTTFCQFSGRRLSHCETKPDRHVALLRNVLTWRRDTHWGVGMGLHETGQTVRCSSKFCRTVQNRKMGGTIKIHVYLNQTV